MLNTANNSNTTTTTTNNNNNHNHNDNDNITLRADFICSPSPRGGSEKGGAEQKGHLEVTYLKVTYSEVMFASFPPFRTPLEDMDMGGRPIVGVPWQGSVSACLAWGDLFVKHTFVKAPKIMSTSETPWHIYDLDGIACLELLV